MAGRAKSFARRHWIRCRILLTGVLLAIPAFAFPGPNPGITAGARKTVPVQVQTKGRPSFGYSVTDTRARPDSVLISGPAETLSEMEAARTHRIDITGLSETLRQEAGLDLPEDVRAVVGNQSVTAFIVIEKQLMEKTFEGVPIRAVNAAYPYTIQPGAVTITLRGAMLDFSDSFSKTDIRVYVDLGGLEPGIYVKPVRINPPNGLRLVGVSPQVFTIQIQSRNQPKSGKSDAAGTRCRKYADHGRAF